MMFAKDIYEQGSYSNSVAKLTIPQGLPVPIDRLESFKGLSKEGKQIELYSMGTYEDGTQEIELHYVTSPDQNNYNRCHVGGNPEPFTAGCLEEAGRLKYDAVSIEYEYDIIENNVNYRHLQAFSIHADYRMRPNGNKLIPYFAEFQRFVDYYGSFDAADHLIQAAFGAGAVPLGLAHYDFSRYGLKARGELVKIATVHLIFHFMVIRSMEAAIVDCENGCRQGTCTDTHLHMLDEAVAFYTGATEGKDGKGEGQLAYSLADEMCVHFRTCGPEGNLNHGTSYVNHKIFDHFEQMQKSLVHRQCADVRRQKTKIAALMHVPITQALILHAYENQHHVEEEREAKGVAYAAALLPMLNFCEKGDAKIVFENMKVGHAGLVDFEVVKSTLEHHYDCLSITCSEVGGLWDQKKWSFVKGAEPCGEYEILPSPLQKFESGVFEATEILFFIFAIVACCLGFLFYRGQQAMKRRRFVMEHGIDYDSDNDSEDSDDGIYA